MSRAPLRFEIPPGSRPSSCRSCKAEIFWIVTLAGKRMPVDPTGESHFSSCPNAAQHRGHPRSESLIVPQFDPPIECGHFRAYRRSDGKIAVADSRRHFADRTVQLVPNEDVARKTVRALAEKERP